VLLLLLLLLLRLMMMTMTTTTTTTTMMMMMMIRSSPHPAPYTLCPILRPPATSLHVVPCLCFSSYPSCKGTIVNTAPS
jgi:hypothetical protein